jgi:arylsulfatase
MGKWHQGDIEEASPQNQGFDFASWPMHNQATFNLMHAAAEEQAWANGVSREAEKAEMAYTLDPAFRPRGWVLGLEARKGEKSREWGVKPGDDDYNYSYEYYRKLNQHFHNRALEQLRELAAKDEPFFLNYWGQNPIDFGRVGREFTQANGGAWVESMKQLDTWVGELLAEVDKLGIAENTVVILMGDNGTMEQALGYTGFTDMIYRGFKANSLEGGIRVPAFIRWPAAIEAHTYAGDMIHVSDLYTTMAVIAQAEKHIPRDRIVDGVNQTDHAALGRRHPWASGLHPHVRGAELRCDHQATIQGALASAGFAVIQAAGIRSLSRPERREAPQGSGHVVRRLFRRDEEAPHGIQEEVSGSDRAGGQRRSVRGNRGATS